jgi:hypothetical protein
MKRNPTLLTVAFFLTACATATSIVPPELQYVDVPALDTVATAEIGETLVSKGKLYVFDGLELQERITDNGFAREYYIEPGAMRLERTDADGNQYFVPALDAYFVNDKTFGRRVRPSNAYLVRKKDGTLEMTGYYDLTTAGKISPPSPRHKVGKVVDLKKPNFRQELLYGGRAGAQIKISPTTSCAPGSHRRLTTIYHQIRSLALRAFVFKYLKRRTRRSSTRYYDRSLICLEYAVWQRTESRARKGKARTRGGRYEDCFKARDVGYRRVAHLCYWCSLAADRGHSRHRICRNR